MRLPAPRSRGALLLYAAGAVVVLLALAQVLLPRIAAARIRSRLARYGTVQSISVSAWPAIKLLWGNLDSVRIRARTLTMSTSRAESLLWEAHDAATIAFSASQLELGPLRLHDVHVSKRGSSLGAQALAGAAEVSAALPAGADVQLVRSGGGEVEVRVSGSLFGLGASINAVARASEGKLVVQPAGTLLGALQLTVFSDPHIYVEGVEAHTTRGDPPSYRLGLRALLR